MKKALIALALCLTLSAALAVPAPAQTGTKSSAKPVTPDDKAGLEVHLTAELLTGLAFRNIGPAVMSGRISDIVIHPRNRHTWYVAVGSGGLWKTENAGTTWASILDTLASYSIGCVTLDPSNPEIVWVGTGENVSGRHVGFGDGVYRSLNGGKSWKNMGLGTSEHIGRILVDPRSSDVVYVAAVGPLWSAGGDRGLYKTADGGKSWTCALEISRDTGVTSAEFDPADPGDREAARELAAETARNNARIAELQQLINGASLDTEIRTTIEDQVRIVQKEQERLQQLAAKEHEDRGLFGRFW